MTIRDEFRAAAEEYARCLERRREEEAATLAAAAAGQHDANAAAFGTAFSDALDDLERPAPTEIDDLADLAEAIRNDAPQENS